MDEHLNRLKQEEYQVQFCDIHSDMIYDMIHRSIKHIIHKNCKKLTESLQQNHAKSDEESKHIKQVITNTEKTCLRNIEPHLLEIKKKVNSWMRIPDNVLLPEDAKQAVQYDESKLNYIASEKQYLLLSLKKARIYQATLKEKLAYLSNLNECFENDEKVQTFIDKNEPQISATSSAVMQNVEEMEKSNDLISKLGLTDKNIYNPNIDHITLKQLD